MTLRLAQSERDTVGVVDWAGMPPARTLLSFFGKTAKRVTTVADPLLQPKDGVEQPASPLSPHSTGLEDTIPRATKKPRRAADGTASTPDSLVGTAVEIFWPSENEWFAGVISVCAAATGAHEIRYADGTCILHDLTKTQYRTVDAARPPEVSGASAAVSTASLGPAAELPAEPQCDAEVGASAGAAKGTSTVSSGDTSELAPIFAPHKSLAAAPATSTQRDQTTASAKIAPIFGNTRCDKPSPADYFPKKKPASGKKAAQAISQRAQDTLDASAVSGTAPAAKVADMFLTKAQKARARETELARAREENLRALREQEQRNRQADQQLSKGINVNPFFKQCNSSARSESQQLAAASLPRLDVNAPRFITEQWLQPGGAAHVYGCKGSSKCSAAAKQVCPVPAFVRCEQPKSRLPEYITLIHLDASSHEETVRHQQSSTSPRPVRFRPLDDATIESFARSEAAIRLLSPLSKVPYSDLPRSSKVTINLFQRCLGHRFGGQRANGKIAVDASGEHCLNSLGQELWCHLYGPVCSNDVCGNRQSAMRLASWLKARKSKMCAKPQGRRRPADSDSDSDDDFIDPHKASSARNQADMWESAGDFNLVLLYGPPGAGKSSAIRAVALECGYSKIEINPSDKRNGKAILDMCGEATQSHGLTKWAGQSQGGQLPEAKSSLRGSKKRPAAKIPAGRGAKALKREEKTIQDGGLDSASSKSGPDLSMIVFEEVDVLFEDERGFFGALATLSADTKRPIILTSTTENLGSGALPLDMLHCAFDSPSVEDMCTLLRCICLTEVKAHKFGTCHIAGLHLLMFYVIGRAARRK